MLDAFKKLFEILPHTDRLKFAVLFGLMLFGTLLEVIGIGMIPVFISAVADSELLFNNRYAGPLLTFLDIDNVRDLLITGGFILIAVFLIKAIYLIMLHYAKSKFVFGRFEVIATKLFKIYMFAPYTFHLNRNTAELIRNVTNETSYISNNVMKPLLRILMEGITSLGILILLLFVEPIITLVTFLILGGSGGLILKLLKGRLRMYGKIASQERLRMIQGVNEGLGGFKDVTVMNRQYLFMDRFNHFVANLKKAEIFKNLSGDAVKPVIEFMAVGGMMVIAFVLIFQGRAIAAIIPVLTLFGAATIRLMPAVSRIIGELTKLRYYIYALEPVHKDLMEQGHRDMALDDRSASDTKLPFESEVELENIIYHYPNTTEQALCGVSLTIPQGSAVGFVGPSGSGKSTIVDVILGLLEPQTGRILVDGTDVAGSKRTWQNNVGYIPQFIYLSDDTIRNNIAFGIPEKEISDEKIEAAVKAAQLEELVEMLEEGLDSMIGERGVRLSGGQRQRIGIARAIYDNPEVLIMDEATSALDNVTEKQVIEAIEALKGERTIIMIAHRLTTVMHCDRLYMMEKGRIINQGTYGELIGVSEKFRKMAMEESQ